MSRERGDGRDDQISRFPVPRAAAYFVIAVTLFMFGTLAGCGKPGGGRLIGTWHGFVVPSPEDEASAETEAEQQPEWILEFHDFERVTVRKRKVNFTFEFDAPAGADAKSSRDPLRISSEEGYTEPVVAPWEVLGKETEDKALVDIQIPLSADWVPGYLQFMATFEGNDRFTCEMQGNSLRFERASAKP